MKKLITILTLMIVLVGAVFATDATLTINAQVKEVKPEFTLGGALVASDSEVPASYESADTTIDTEKNIATEDIYIAIAVFQNNKSFYQDTTGFDLTVTATPLILSGKTAQNATADEKTAAPTIVAYAAGADVKHGNNPEIIDFHPIVKSHDGSEVVYTVTYPSGKKIEGNAVYAQSAAKVGTATFKWTHNDELFVGTYTGTITLTYTAN